MKLDNRDLVLRGLLGILPAQLERYLRSALGDHCTPETLRALLEGNEPAPEVPDLADLSTQIRILTARDVDGRLPPPPQGLTAARGVLLVIAYCLGLGLPFLLVALGSSAAVRGIDVLRRHSRAIQIAGGVAMVIVGLMLLTGAWNSFIGWTRQLVVGFGGTII